VDFLKAILAVTPYRADPRSMPPDCVGGERLASIAPARGEWKSGLNKSGAARIVAWPRQLTIQQPTRPFEWNPRALGRWLKLLAAARFEPAAVPWAQNL
jgi:hypothetical protein